MKNSVEEALSDSQYLQLIKKLVHSPDLSVSKTSQHGDSSSSPIVQDSLDILEAGIVSTFMLLWVIHSVIICSTVLASIHHNNGERVHF
jgi:hypothetical protein